MKKEKIKTNLVCGITSSSIPTLAHYLIIFKNLIKLQEKYNLFFLIGDLHALSTKKKNRDIPIFQKELAKIAFSCGIYDQNVYIQSQLKEHLILSYILSTFQPIGQMNRMTQFKSKEESLKSLALYSYPILMASDILLFDADVLIGPDQKQHLELTRDIGTHLNNKYYNLFKLPEIIPMLGTEYRIRDLQNPEKKMSKSVLDKKSTIFLTDSDIEIEKKIKNSKTDSENIIKFDFKNKPGISNLILIYALCKEIDLETAEKELNKICKNYLDLKIILKDIIILTLKPIKEKIKFFDENSNILKSNLKKGLDRAKIIAEKKIDLISKKIGIPYID